MKGINTFIMLIAALAMAACSDDGGHTADVEYVEMPVRLSVPASGMADPTRTPGDPGTYEKFEIPTYGYFYFCTDHSLPTAKVTRLVATLNAANWVKEKIGNDSVYTYRGNITAQLPKERTTGEVFVALCNVPIFAEGKEPSPTTCDAIKRTTCTLTDENALANLQNLYSSPYNKMKQKADGSGEEYYGTIEDITTQTPKVNMVLYHVAAKIDITWNVAPAMQQDVKLTYMEATGLVNHFYLFKPMETPFSSTHQYTWRLLADTYSYAWLQSSGQGDYGSHIGLKPNPANQWYGRLSFYAIPHFSSESADGRFNLRLRMMQNGNEQTAGLTATSGLTLTNSLDIGYANEYTPWIRLNLNISNVLYTDGELQDGKQQ